MSDKAKLFEYAAIYNPTKDEIKEGKKAELIVDVKRILAKDDQVASMVAIKSIPSEFDDRLHQIDIVVRPF